MWGEHIHLFHIPVCRGDYYSKLPYLGAVGDNLIHGGKISFQGAHLIKGWILAILEVLVYFG